MIVRSLGGQAAVRAAASSIALGLAAEHDAVVVQELVEDHPLGGGRRRIRWDGGHAM